MVYSAEAKETFNAPDAPKSVMEALQQRLDKYKSTYEEAKAAGESSKARRMQRDRQAVPGGHQGSSGQATGGL